MYPTFIIICLLQTAFEFDDHAVAKKFVLTKAAKLSKDWRARLTKYFLYDSNGDVIQTRPEEFASVITQEQWDQFVAVRTSHEFKEISDKNSECATKNEYPYMRGRDTFAIIQDELVDFLHFSFNNLDEFMLW